MRFCFYSEYQDLKGGYTTLILTLIIELHNQGQQVVLINYKNGLIAQELKSAGIEIPIIEKNRLTRDNASDYIKSTDVLIIPKFYENLAILFDANPRVIYYDINDYICRISDYKFGIKLPFLSKKLIKKLLIGNALIFMDDTGPGNLQREFGISINNPKYLPVAITDEKNNVYLEKSRNLDKSINITYIGRAVDWKMYPLKKIIEDSLLCGKRINFHIVIDNITSFRTFIDVENFHNKLVTFKVYENLLPSEIRAFLINHADLHFGMGTTSIHAAALGIPTILMDYSTKPFPKEYTYRWLFNSKFFSLGKNIETVAVPEGIPLENIFEMINKANERESLSIKSFQYVAEHHAVSAIVPKLTHYCSQCNFRLRDSRNLNPYYFRLHTIFKSIAKPHPKEDILDET